MRGWYRKLSNFALPTFTFSPKNVPQTQHHLFSRINKTPPKIFNNNSSTQRALFSPASTRVIGKFQPRVQQQHFHNPWSPLSRRFYSVNKNNPTPEEEVRYILKRIALLLLVGSAIFVGRSMILGARKVIYVVYSQGNFETMPFTNRKHLLIVSESDELATGERIFETFIEESQGKIFPPEHPDSVRVSLITRQIVQALEKWLSEETDSSYELEFERRDESNGAEGSRCATKFLMGLNWEVVIVDTPNIGALCVAGGKILLGRGLLEHFKADAELATVIGHEVARIVARHHAEETTLSVLVHLLLGLPVYRKQICDYLLRAPSRRRVLEADYIGLLLMASAGYDPQEAPRTYLKLGKFTEDGAFQYRSSTHPSPEKRAKTLSKAKVMQEALDIYWGLMAG